MAEIERHDGSDDRDKGHCMVVVSHFFCILDKQYIIGSREIVIEMVPMKMSKHLDFFLNLTKCQCFVRTGSSVSIISTGRDDNGNQGGFIRLTCGLDFPKSSLNRLEFGKWANDEVLNIGLQ
jgi:hypothetical protein